MSNANNFQTTLNSIFEHTCKQHPELTEFAVQQRREMISNTVWDFHKQKVSYGPFSGLKLTQNSHWGKYDKGTMCLGLYEQEVLNDLTRHSNEFEVFIDLGAADGYYGIGVLVGEIFKKSYCFELTEAGQSVIEINAKLNDVADRLVIKGAANKKFYTEIPQSDLKKSVLFVDVEGAEFEIFDEDTFAAFNESVIYIELHDWFYPDGDSKLKKLKDDCNKTHKITEIKMGARDLSSYHVLSSLNDTDRWILCSEGRARLMTWLRLDPI